MPGNQVARFVLGGIINTGIDFLLFLSLRYLHFSVVPANIISTSSGMIASFLLNRNFVFADNSSKRRRQLVKFFIVTSFGLWVIQPLIIVGVLHLNHHINLTDTLPSLNGRKVISADFLGKLAASTTLIWNYLWYSRFIFVQRSKGGSVN